MQLQVVAPLGFAGRVIAAYRDGVAARDLVFLVFGVRRKAWGAERLYVLKVVLDVKSRGEQVPASHTAYMLEEASQLGLDLIGITLPRLARGMRLPKHHRQKHTKDLGTPLRRFRGGARVPKGVEDERRPSGGSPHSGGSNVRRRRSRAEKRGRACPTNARETQHRRDKRRKASPRMSRQTK